jgi:hypothetical protein
MRVIRRWKFSEKAHPCGRPPDAELPGLRGGRRDGVLHAAEHERQSGDDESGGSVHGHAMPSWMVTNSGIVVPNEAAREGWPGRDAVH